MDLHLNDKVAIVTGAGMWIGKAICLRLAQEDATVVVNNIHPEIANKIADEIRASGGKAFGVQADVTKMPEVEKMVKTVLDKFGKIDILVNNAGKGGGSTLLGETTEENWDMVIARNLKSTRNCCRAVINHMTERKTGRIINIASVAGVIGTPGGVAYSAAKAAIFGLTKALAKEVSLDGVRVNCVCPGPTGWANMPAERIAFDLKEVGMGRMGKPEEIANMVAVVASDVVDYMTGMTLIVGGLRPLGAWTRFEQEVRR